MEELLLEPTINHAILSDDLKKVYPGRDGNPDKFAVRGLFLSVPQGECFGMLGPNGAGKTSFINMVSYNCPTDMYIGICLHSQNKCKEVLFSLKPPYQ